MAFLINLLTYLNETVVTSRIYWTDLKILKHRNKTDSPISRLLGMQEVPRLGNSFWTALRTRHSPSTSELTVYGLLDALPLSLEKK